jgi:hypothetical protein
VKTAIAVILLVLWGGGCGAGGHNLLFDTEDHGDAGGDGEADIVSAKNVDKDDVHYTSTAVAQRLDGSVIWRWGDPNIGDKKLRYDVAC